MADAAILKRLIKQLTANGMEPGKARAVAIKRMREAGNIEKNSTEATSKGKKRGKMTPAQRAKDRAAKKRGGKPSDYKYNKNNNSAVKGRVNKSVKKRK